MTSPLRLRRGAIRDLTRGMLLQRTGAVEKPGSGNHPRVEWCDTRLTNTEIIASIEPSSEG